MEICEVEKDCEVFQNHHVCDSGRKTCLKHQRWVEERLKEDGRFKFFNKLKYNFVEKYLNCRCAECEEPAVHRREEFYNNGIALCENCAEKWDKEKSSRSKSSSRKYSALKN